MMKKLWFLVVWFLGLLFLGNGAFASYTQVFSDDFNRANATGTAIANGWLFPGYQNDGTTGIDTRIIKDYQLVGGDESLGGSGIWKSSVMLQSGYLLSDGKATIEFKNSVNNNMYALLARVDMFSGISVCGDYNTNIKRLRILITSGTANQICYQQGQSIQNTSITVSWSIANDANLRLELLTSGTTIIANLYDITTTPTLIETLSVSGINFPTTAGLWGINHYTNSSSSDNYALYRDDVEFTIFSSANNVKWGNTITWTITDDEDRIISNFSDGGAGGVFSPTSVELNSSNGYTATVTYTPAKLGQQIITADVSGGETFNIPIGVWSYSTKIGFIGDSISAGATASTISNRAPNQTTTNLGKGFSTINASVGGAQAYFYANDTCSAYCSGGSGVAIMTNAINSFQGAGVEFVSIMLGANDSHYVESQLPATYKMSMQKIIDDFKNVGIKHIILQVPFYRPGVDATANQYLQEYTTVSLELVSENSGYVSLGDTTSYARFYDNYLYHSGDAFNAFADKVHPNDIGHTYLGSVWSQAILNDFLYQVNPVHQRMSGNTCQLTTSWTLTYFIGKRIGELTWVKIDGSLLISGTDYTLIDSTWTTILFTNTYLNWLTAGIKNLMVEFYGGVNINDTFTITSAPSNPTNPSWWGGGGSSASKDNCPNGDFSSSYYDWICGTNPTTNDKVGTGLALSDKDPLTNEQEDTAIPNNEILSAYDWAFSHNITTLAPITNANPDGTVIRQHFAKMVVNYALNALGWTLPEKVPSQCHWKDGSNAWESSEMKEYAVKACSLGLMGIDMDYFQPYTVVSRAQFGTVLSRLLRQNTYVGGKPYYVKHLEALKENWIMTQIDNPEGRTELRQWVRLMLMRSSK